MKEPEFTFPTEESGTVTLNIDDEYPLFRYRDGKENSLSALVSNEFWLGKPIYYNDVFDSRGRTDSEYVLKGIKEYISKNESRYELIKSLFELDKELIRAKDVNEYLEETITPVLNQPSFQDISLGCLSSKIDSPLMWGHYSNNSNGFAIEYKYKTLISACERVKKDFTDYLDLISQFAFKVFPINYTKSRYDQSDDILDYYKDWINYQIENKGHITIDSINVHAQAYLDAQTIEKKNYNTWKVCLTKMKEWNYEYEWRMILPSRVEKLIIKPDSLVLGLFASPLVKYVVSEYGLKNNVPVYQMYEDMKSTDFILKRRKLSVEELNYITEKK